jgi:hypothetical protein
MANDRTGGLESWIGMNLQGVLANPWAFFLSNPTRLIFFSHQRETWTIERVKG